MNSFIISKDKYVFNPKTNSKEIVTYYQCLYCKTDFDSYDKARSHIETHELILVPLSRGDLNRLHKFLYLRQESLLTTTLIDIIRRYARKGALK